MRVNDLSARRCTVWSYLFVLAVLMVVGPGVGTATAEWLFNADMKNETGDNVNDFHVKLEADEDIYVDVTYETGGDVEFDAGVVSGNGTRTVTIDWSGANVAPGQTSHIGAAGPDGASTPEGLEITECWWTYNGQKVGDDVDITLCSWMFNGTSGTGNWLVILIEIFRDAGGTNLIGRQWVEGRGTDAMISNQLTGRPIYARWAMNTPGDKIPIQNLNEALGGFGAFGPITTLPIEIPTVSQWGLIVLAFALLATGIIVAIRRKRVAA